MTALTILACCNRQNIKQTIAALPCSKHAVRPHTYTLPSKRYLPQRIGKGRDRLPAIRFCAAVSIRNDLPGCQGENKTSACQTHTSIYHSTSMHRGRRNRGNGYNGYIGRFLRCEASRDGRVRQPRMDTRPVWQPQSASILNPFCEI